MLAFSQTEQNRIAFGLFGSYGINMHSADFKKLPDCPSCSPGYRDGSGSGPGFGLVLDYPLDDKFTISGRLLFKDLSGELIAKEGTTIITENGPEAGEFEHSLDATLGVFGFEPSVKYNIFDKLYLNVGLLVSVLATKDYAQVERLTKPSEYGTFLNQDGTDSHSRERNKFSGELEAANSLYIAPMLSMSYKWILTKKGDLFLEPEASFYYGLTNIVSDDLVDKWTVSNLSFGISLKYSPAPPEPIIEEHKKIEKIDSIRIESDRFAKRTVIRGKEVSNTSSEQIENVIIYTENVSRTDTVYSPKEYKLNGTMATIGVNSDGTTVANPTFKIEEFIFNRLDPLLNYIFFDENSSAIPARYKVLTGKEKDEFNIDSLYQISTLDIYHNILNVTGRRLEKYPKASITLTGCNSDFGPEKDNTELSRNRAEQVKEYLVNAWKINPDRIKIKARNLPEKPSTPTTEAEKIEENRRVEISSDDYRMIEPIFIENIKRTATPLIARFKPAIVSEAGIKEWEIIAYQQTPGTPELYRKSGKGELPEQFDWNLENDEKSMPKVEAPVFYQLSVTDNKDNHFVIDVQHLGIDLVTVNQKREQRLDDYEIEKFSLILFDFDKSDIEGNNRRITELIKSRLKPHSEIEIIGFTDRTGDDAYNLKLSERRSTTTKASLGRTDASSKGIGEQELLYNNELPEGRFYCRTVEVTVKTKLVNK